MNLSPTTIVKVTALVAAFATSPSANAWSVNDTYNKVTATYNYLATHTNKHAWNAYSYARDTKALAQTIQDKVDVVDGKAAGIEQTLNEVRASIAQFQPTGVPFDDSYLDVVIGVFHDAMPPLVEQVAALEAFEPADVQATLRNISEKLADVDPRLAPVGDKLDAFIGAAPNILLHALSQVDVIDQVEAKLADFAGTSLLTDLTNADSCESVASVAQALSGHRHQPVDELLSDIARRVHHAERLAAAFERLNDLLPDDTTVGGTVGAGATISIPNPATPLFAVVVYHLNDAALVGRHWLEIYASCNQDALLARLSDFLTTQGY